MREETRTLPIDGRNTRVKVQLFEESDRKRLRRFYGLWVTLNRGMKAFKFRSVNLPEGISEGAFCLCLGSDFARALHVFGPNGSFDVVNLRNGKRIQIKASSVESDLTSFGPRSVWDIIYFLDFYRNGKNDGSFDIYLIPNDRIYSQSTNKAQTFADQQKERRRPRFSIMKEIIIKDKLKPLRTCHL